MASITGRGLSHVTRKRRGMAVARGGLCAARGGAWLSLRATPHMMTKLLPLLAAVLLLSGAASAQSTAASILEPPVPDIVRLGFEAYQKDGVQAGLAIWLKGSPIQNDAAQVSNGLNTLQGLYGRLIGW